MFYVPKTGHETLFYLLQYLVSKTVKAPQARQFKFWLEQTLQDGMQYQSALFQRICTLDYEHRHQLYQKANQLAQNGADTIITRNDKACHLWLNLKCKADR